MNCNSINSCEGGDYCKQCSHSHQEGSVVVKGKKYKFEFNPMFGFLGDDIDKLKEDSPVWGELQNWYENR